MRSPGFSNSYHKYDDRYEANNTYHTAAASCRVRWHLAERASSRSQSLGYIIRCQTSTDRNDQACQRAQAQARSAHAARFSRVRALVKAGRKTLQTRPRACYLLLAYLCTQCVYYSNINYASISVLSVSTGKTSV